uniref:Uncharacterized protein n=1 Tax=Arundo donax TaxID=35708 RepID=A0A0A9BYZ5_ARUDO
MLSFENPTLRCY